MKRWLHRLACTRPGRLLKNILRRYFDHDVGRQGAALAYYLLFSLFPFLIFLSSVLGLLRLDISAILRGLEPLLPAGVLDLIGAYLTHVSEASNTTLLWFGLVFAIYFPMRAANCLMLAVRQAYHLGEPKHRLAYTGKVLLYTLCLLCAIALTLLLMTVGRRALGFLGEALSLPAQLVELWSVLRFLLLGVVVFAAVGLLYALSQDERQSSRAIVPGALLALAVWLLLSAAYAFYVEHFANYSVIYGALGAVVVLLVWLYLTAVVLIMGAELNDTLLSLGREEASR